MLVDLNSEEYCRERNYVTVYREFLHHMGKASIDTICDALKLLNSMENLHLLVTWLSASAYCLSGDKLALEVVHGPIDSLLTFV